MLGKIGTILKVAAVLETIILVFFSIIMIINMVSAEGATGLFAGIVAAAIALVSGLVGVASTYGMGEMMDRAEYIHGKVYIIDEIKERVETLERKSI